MTFMIKIKSLKEKFNKLFKCSSSMQHQPIGKIEPNKEVTVLSKDRVKETLEEIRKIGEQFQAELEENRRYPEKIVYVGEGSFFLKKSGPEPLD